MVFEQNWQNYRTMFNEHIAIFSADLNAAEQFGHADLINIIQFDLPYQPNDVGLPQDAQQQSLFRELFKLLTQLTALPDTLYAGHIITQGAITVYFYCKDPKDINDVLGQFENIQKIEFQPDPQWDIYFDFLLPSPLESKINASEEILEMLKQQGRSLSQIYSVEHIFYFADEENMFNFAEKVDSSTISYTTMRHSESKVPINDDEFAFILKIEQELSFDNAEIYQTVEKFEQLSQQFNGDYSGWSCDDLYGKDRRYLN